MLESPHFNFNENIFLISLSNWEIFIILDTPRGELQFFWNVQGNGAMYKEFKLKNTNWIVMFTEFLQITLFTFKEHNLFKFWMCQETKYKVCWNVKNNEATYKEFKLKNRNQIVMFNFYKSPFSFSKGITCSFIHQFQHFLYHWMRQVEN